MYEQLEIPIPFTKLWRLYFGAGTQPFRLGVDIWIQPLREKMVICEINLGWAGLGFGVDAWRMRIGG